MSEAASDDDLSHARQMKRHWLEMRGARQTVLDPVASPVRDFALCASFSTASCVTSVTFWCCGQVLSFIRAASQMLRLSAGHGSALLKRRCDCPGRERSTILMCEPVSDCDIRYRSR